MVEEFRARRDLVVDGLNAIPGIECAVPAGRVLRLPRRQRHRADRRRVRRPAARRGRRVRARRHGVRSGRRATTSGSATPTRRENLAEALERIERVRRRLGRRATPRVTRPLPRVFVTRGHPRRGPRRASARRATRTSGRTSCRRRATSCCGASRAWTALLALLTDRVDDELLDARRAAAEGRVATTPSASTTSTCPACTRRGIAVGNTPGVLTETTADLAWALLMAAARRVAEGDRYVRDGRWLTWGPLTAARAGRPRRARSGSSGFGRIGQAVARRARGLRDARPVPRRPAAARRRSRRRPARRSRPLDELLAQSDFVSAPRQPRRRRRAT